MDGFDSNRAQREAVAGSTELLGLQRQHLKEQEFLAKLDAEDSAAHAIGTARGAASGAAAGGGGGGGAQHVAVVEGAVLAGRKLPNPAACGGGGACSAFVKVSAVEGGAGSFHFRCKTAVHSTETALADSNPSWARSAFTMVLEPPLRADGARDWSCLEGELLMAVYACEGDGGGDGGNGGGGGGGSRRQHFVGQVAVPLATLVDGAASASMHGGAQATHGGWFGLCDREGKDTDGSLRLSLRLVLPAKLPDQPAQARAERGGAEVLPAGGAGGGAVGGGESGAAARGVTFATSGAGQQARKRISGGGGGGGASSCHPSDRAMRAHQMRMERCVADAAITEWKRQPPPAPRPGVAATARKKFEQRVARENELLRRRRQPTASDSCGGGQQGQGQVSAAAAAAIAATRAGESEGQRRARRAAELASDLGRREKKERRARREEATAQHALFAGVGELQLEARALREEVQLLRARAARGRSQLTKAERELREVLDGIAGAVAKDERALQQQEQQQQPKQHYQQQQQQQQREGARSAVGAAAASSSPASPAARTPAERALIQLDEQHRELKELRGQRAAQLAAATAAKEAAARTVREAQQTLEWAAVRRHWRASGGASLPAGQDVGEHAELDRVLDDVMALKVRVLLLYCCAAACTVVRCCCGVAAASLRRRCGALRG